MYIYIDWRIAVWLGDSCGAQCVCVCVLGGGAVCFHRSFCADCRDGQAPTRRRGWKHCSFRPVASDEEEEVGRNACRDAVVREYLNNLPCVFEGDACPSHVVEDERVENEIAQLDRDGLKERVRSETRRCNEALMELLEQEQQMSSTLTGMRHLESRLRDSEGVPELLRQQLREANKCIEELRCEKADALSQLSDTKMDLADVSERTNYLQRCIDAKTKGERERNAFLLSAYRAIPADPNFGASILRAKSPSLEDGIDRGGDGARRSGIQQKGPSIHRPPQEGRKPGTGAKLAMRVERNVVVSLGYSDPQGHSPRQASLRGTDPHCTCFVQEPEVAQGDECSWHNNGAAHN